MIDIVKTDPVEIHAIGTAIEAAASATASASSAAASATHVDGVKTYLDTNYNTLSTDVTQLKSDIVEKPCYDEIKSNTKYIQTKLSVGFVWQGETRTDIKRGIFTKIVDLSNFDDALLDDDTFGCRVDLFDETQTYTRTYYNVHNLKGASEKYGLFFAYPLRTGGNSTATDDEINALLSNFVIISDERTITGLERKVVVSADGSGDYITIQSAIDDADNNTTIFIKDGTYKETVIVNKYVHLVGESKHGTILYQNIGDYNNCPLLITQGSVHNMTIKSLAPSDISVLTNYAYAIHLDKNFANESKYRKCEISNCYIYSEVNDAIGAGTNYDSEYDVHDCFVSVRLNPVKTGACAFKCHNGNNQTDGSVTLMNNVFFTPNANGTTCYDILFHNGGISNTNIINLNMAGNAFKYFINTCENIFVQNDINTKGTVLSISATTTTNANGIISSSKIPSLAGKLVLMAKCTNINDSICTIGYGSGSPWIKVTDYQGVPKSNMDVSVTYYYVS